MKALKPDRVDVFGDQNLEETVEEFVEQKGYASYVADASVSDPEIQVTVRKGKEDLEYGIFEKLFNPVEGVISDVPDGLKYASNLYDSFEIVYESSFMENSSSFSANDIRQIQEKAVDEEDFSEEKFRQVYEEVR